MLKARFLRLLCAVALVASLLGPAMPIQAAPLEVPSVNDLIQWLTDVWNSEHVLRRAEAHPTADPNGQSTLPVPTAPESSTESLPDNGGEIHPTADPNG